MNEYKIRKRSTVCMVTGKPFADGDPIVSAIYEDPDEGFVRRDMLAVCFPDAESPYSFWKGHHVVHAAEARRLDFDLALSFLDKLLREADPEREAMVYALTLLLSRKRRVRILETQPLPEGALLSVRVPRDEEDEVVSVRAPALEPEEIDALQAELAQLFGFAAPDADSPAT